MTRAQNEIESFAVRLHQSLVERYHTRPALARGWRIRQLMGGLSWVVKPARAEAVSVLNGAVILDESEDKGHTIYSLVLKKRIPTYELAKKHWMRGVTLQNLAIRIYLEELQSLGFEGLDERALKRDMKEVEKWEQTLPPERRDWGILVVTKGKPNVHLPAEEYSDGWMRRKRGKSAKNK